MKSSRHGSGKKRITVRVTALAVGLGLMATPAAAGGGDLSAGLLGGLAVGTLVGSAAAQPRYYVPYYVPAPVFVPAPRCWIERQYVWDGYGYVIGRARVCE